MNRSDWEKKEKPFHLSLSFLHSLCDLFLAYEYLPGSWVNQVGSRIARDSGLSLPK